MTISSAFSVPFLLCKDVIGFFFLSLRSRHSPLPPLLFRKKPGMIHFLAIYSHFPSMNLLEKVEFFGVKDCLKESLLVEILPPFYSILSYLHVYCLAFSIYEAGITGKTGSLSMSSEKTNPFWTSYRTAGLHSLNVNKYLEQNNSSIKAGGFQLQLNFQFQLKFQFWG